MTPFEHVTGDVGVTPSRSTSVPAPREGTLGLAQKNSDTPHHFALSYLRAIVVGMAKQPHAERRPMRIHPVNQDVTHESARARQRRKRERDFKEALPETRDIDRAIVAALREMIAQNYRGLVGYAWRSGSDCGRIIEAAVQLLEREGCDTQNPAFIARILHRLGDHTRDENLTRSQL